MSTLRPDRLITLGLVKPVVQLQRFLRASAKTPILPILMYHSISEDPEPGFSPYYKVCTAPKRFAEQMQWLADAGCRGVSLQEGLSFLDGKPRSGPRPVAITFDDGFRDFHTEAFPILRRFGFTATMYLPTGYIAEERKSFKSRECLTWTEVKELQQAGMEFGSHTVTHPKLVELDWPQITAELRDSRATLEMQLGRPVRSFAYPFAFPQAKVAFAKRFCETLIQTGYKNCVTTAVGQARPGANLLQLKRLPVNNADDRALLVAKLRGAYDWVSLPQQLRKKVSLLCQRASKPKNSSS